MTIPFSESGTYTLAFTAKTANGERSMSQKLSVDGNPPVTIARKAATRLYPIGVSPMDVTVTFKGDFQGSVTDSVPLDFKIANISPDASITHDDSAKLLTWKGSWKAGETATFHYDYDAPDVSPDFFTVGPLLFASSDGTVFAEQRSWQIANDDDSMSQYIGGSGDGWAVASGGILQFPGLTATSYSWTDIPNGIAPYVGGNGDGWAMGAGRESIGAGARATASAPPPPTGTTAFRQPRATSSSPRARPPFPGTLAVPPRFIPFSSQVATPARRLFPGALRRAEI